MPVVPSVASAQPKVVDFPQTIPFFFGIDTAVFAGMVNTIFLLFTIDNLGLRIRNAYKSVFWTPEPKYYFITTHEKRFMF